MVSDERRTVVVSQHHLQSCTCCHVVDLVVVVPADQMVAYPEVVVLMLQSDLEVVLVVVILQLQLSVLRRAEHEC